MKTGITAVLILVLASISWGSEASATPAPQPTTQADSYLFHRTNDVLFGSVISGVAGAASNRPWVGLVSGIGAGIVNEARYGSHFDAAHLGYISLGAFGSYALLKTMKHDWHHKHGQ
jgi:hypothetical protein